MDNTQQQTAYQKLNDLRVSIRREFAHRSWTNPTEFQTWSDLNVMLNNCDRLYDDLDRTSVECRRIGRPTIAFKEAYQRLDQSITLLEQFVMTAMLMRG